MSIIDTATGQRVRDQAVGIRPNDMAVSPDGRLFVACSGDNTVHVIQTQTLEKVEPGASPKRRPPEGAREILATSLYPSSPEGSTPDAVAVAPDGKTLYVANADNNDVMVVDISAAGRVADRRFHSRGLVSDGAGRLARQPHAVGGQRQGTAFARRATRRRCRERPRTAWRSIIRASSWRARSP